MCSIDKSIDKVSRYFWYRDTKKYGVNTRYQYREILVSRYIEVSSVSPIPSAKSFDYDRLRNDRALRTGKSDNNNNPKK